MIHLDRRYPEKELRQFASQAENVPAAIRRMFLESFTEDQSPDFYAGLVAGLAVARLMCNSLDPELMRDAIGVSVALAAGQALRAAAAAGDVPHGT